MSDSLPTPATVSPVLRGRHTCVRPALPSDYDWLYQIAVLTPAGSRWRLHGEVPNMEQFIQFVYQGSKITSIVENLDGRRLGMVQAWNADPMARHSQITAFLSPEAEGKGWPLEGLLMFVDYAFRAFNLRKIYIETLETELRYYKSLVGAVMHEEGRFRGHKYVFGEWIDCYMLAIYRNDFKEFYSKTILLAQQRSGVEEGSDNDSRSTVEVPTRANHGARPEPRFGPRAT
jgi:RimJ/RimL family protein N-acetyltransferase